MAQIPGLQDKADGSIIEVGRKAGGQQPDRAVVHRRRRQRRCRSTSRAGRRRPVTATTRWPPARATSGRRASSTPRRSVAAEDDNGAKASLLTLVCSRSAAVGELEGVDGARPFCTGDGVGAVLSVIGPRDARGNVVHPTRVVSVNEPCETTPTPFLNTYEGVRVECAKLGEDYSIGQIVPIRGSAPADPAVPADAVTASGSGLDPHISLGLRRPAGRTGWPRPAASAPSRSAQAVADHTDGRTLGFFGEPHGQRARAEPRAGREVSGEELMRPVDDERVTATAGDPAMPAGTRDDSGPPTSPSAASCASTSVRLPASARPIAMLGEAHRRLERGTDLVAAVVETHGRKKTAELLDGHRDHPAALHRVPRQPLPRTRRRRRAGAPARRWCWSTSWPTPTPRAARTRNAGRTSRNCSTPASP